MARAFKFHLGFFFFSLLSINTDYYNGSLVLRCIDVLRMFSRVEEFLVRPLCAGFFLKLLGFLSIENQNDNNRRRDALTV